MNFTGGYQVVDLTYLGMITEETEYNVKEETIKQLLNSYINNKPTYIIVNLQTYIYKGFCNIHTDDIDDSLYINFLYYDDNYARNLTFSVQYKTVKFYIMS